MHDSTNRFQYDDKVARLSIAGLSFVGIADALYMLAYDEGLIDSLICPFFGQGCNIVGRSPHAKHFGVPNAAVGALGYAAMAALAIWSREKPPQQRPVQSLGLSAISLAAFVASVFLTWEQATKVKAWCFWCLLSAGLNLMILPLALLGGGWRSARSFLHTP
ncbi:MAG: vitamin K epoxide reductase family protein [Chloroflexi bacterium]|nr:vitamin K epoxide reductase family protein [Chloroflexota bacterium]